MAFNPLIADVFEFDVPLYIDGNTKKPYLFLELKGSSQTPKIIFDRREIIMPIVPLDITSSCTFKVINCGYENLSLKHNVVEDIGPLDIEIKYIEGR